MNISNDNPDILIYTQERTFHFDPDKSASGVTEEDVICTVNLALVVSEKCSDDSTYRFVSPEFKVTAAI